MNFGVLVLGVCCKEVNTAQDTGHDATGFWMGEEVDFSETFDDLQSWARRLVQIEDFDNKNYYEILRVPRSATPQQILKAYRKLAKKHHPDMRGGNEAIFKALELLKVTLTDPNKREVYDRTFQRPDFDRSRFSGPNYQPPNDHGNQSSAPRRPNFHRPNNHGNRSSAPRSRNLLLDPAVQGSIQLVLLLLFYKGGDIFRFFKWIVMKLVRAIKWILWDWWHPKKDDGPKKDNKNKGPKKDNKNKGPKKENKNDRPKEENKNDGPEEDKKNDGETKENEKDGPKNSKNEGPKRDNKNEGPKKDNKNDGPKEKNENDGLKKNDKNGGPKKENENDGPKKENENDGPKKENENDGPKEDNKNDGPEEENENDGLKKENENFGPKEDMKDTN